MHAFTGTGGNTWPDDSNSISFHRTARNSIQSNGSGSSRAVSASTTSTSRRWMPSPKWSKSSSANGSTETTLYGVYAQLFKTPCIEIPVGDNRKSRIRAAEQLFRHKVIRLLQRTG